MLRKIRDISITATLVLGTLLLMGQVPNFSQLLPPNTVIGRLGTGPGPSQAIPFQTLVNNLPLPTIGGTLVTQPTALFVAPSPTGDDANNCLSLITPCATIEHVLNLCPLGGVCSISLAGGTYTTTTGYNIYYHRVVSITGDCSNHGNVVVNAAANGISLFFVQDYAIGTINCLSITTSGTSVNIVTARQLAIVDIDNVDIIASFSSGTVMVASGGSSLNCGGNLNITVAPAYIAFAIATTGATVTFACAATLQQSGGTIGNTFVADTKSLLVAGGGSFSGAGAGSGTTGNKCVVTDATLVKPSGGTTQIPGNGTCASSITPDAATGAGYLQ